MNVKPLEDFGRRLKSESSCRINFCPTLVGSHNFVSRPRSYLQKSVSSSWQRFSKCPSTKAERNTNFSSGTLKEFEKFKVPSIHSFARDALYTRSSPALWLSTYKNCLENLRVEQNASERFRILSKNLANETAEQTDIAQADSKRHLENRVIDIHFGLGELEWESRLNVEEWQKLDRQRRSLEKLLEKTDLQAQIAQECLYYREKRQDVDLVHDVAEKSLLAELDTVRWCQEGLRQLIKRAENELWSLREAKHVLEKDMADKFSAQEIDVRAAELKNSSPQLGSYSATELVDTCCTVPLTWKEFTSKNCEESKKCRQVSTKLREETTRYMRTAVNALASGWAEASAALSARIREVTTARCEIVESLEKVMTEISEVEGNIEMLKKCIAEKEAPRRVAETRLSLRLNRTGYENCRDSAYTRLVEELPEIAETTDSLQSALRKSEKILQSLFSFKRLLECDLQRKLNSIFIDNEKCLGLRRLCPSIT